VAALRLTLRQVLPAADRGGLRRRGPIPALPARTARSYARRMSEAVGISVAIVTAVLVAVLVAVVFFVVVMMGDDD
jgi:hypothetical protein